MRKMNKKEVMDFRGIIPEMKSAAKKILLEAVNGHYMYSICEGCVKYLRKVVPEIFDKSCEIDGVEILVSGNSVRLMTVKVRQRDLSTDKYSNHRMQFKSAMLSNMVSNACWETTSTYGGDLKINFDVTQGGHVLNRVEFERINRDKWTDNNECSIRTHEASNLDMQNAIEMEQLERTEDWEGILLTKVDSMIS